MNKILKSIVIFAGILAAVQMTGWSATYYVDAVNGDDANSGTNEQPWKTINRVYTWYSGSGPKVQEGDTVLFKNGEYSMFQEDTNVNPTSKYHFHRTNWITYKAVSGHTPTLSSIIINNADHYSDPLYEPGQSYLIFDGFKISNGVSMKYSSYVQILNCKVTGATEPYEGFYAPYVPSGSTGIGARNSHYITIENNDVSYVYRGISLTDSTDNVMVKNNRVHRIAEDGITAPANHVTVTENNVFDINKYWTVIDIMGTKSGDFIKGETVIQEGTGAEGIYDRYSTRYMIYQTNDAALTKFKTQAEGGGTITGQTSKATLSDITLIDPQHTDGIAIHSSYCFDITITKNIIHPKSWNGIKLATYTNGTIKDVTIANNLVYDTNDYAIYMGAEPLSGPGGTYENINIYSNTFISRKLHLRNSAKIDNLYNNILTYLMIDSTALGIVNHGNNIILEETAGTGNTYPFSLNATEVISPDPGFSDASGADYRLAEGSLAIDFGDPAHAPATDILGNLRDAQPDAGCYEYGASSTTPQPPEPEPPIKSEVIIPEVTSLIVYNNIIKQGKNTSANILCLLHEAGNLSVKIYDAKGKEIITLFDGYHEAGRELINWEAQDKEGRSAGSGIYVVQMKTGAYTEQKKIAVVK